MKKYAWIAVIALGVSVLGPQTAFAGKKKGGDKGGAKVDFATADADTSGEVSLAELQTVNPKANEKMFTKLDKDSSGGLNAEEYAATAKKKGKGKKKGAAGGEGGEE